MKKIKYFMLILPFVVALFFSFDVVFSGSIKGKIIPTEGASQVWAMSTADTLKAAISQGLFEIPNVKAGTYKIFIDATDPYKDVVREGVQVSDGGSVDLGEIQLEK
jgi:hypothetical protein